MKPAVIIIIITYLLASASPSAEEAAPRPAGSPAHDAGEAFDPVPASPGNSGESICLMIESAAGANGLPLEFFARVIWQESRFNPAAVGPLTRTGERARGIAQFMPGTAAERALLDPFDPVQALPKSAEFLRELRDQFGNLGLAAAAYNAGPRRVRDWLAGTGQLPGETQRYVLAITGRTAEDWARLGRGTSPADAPRPGCAQLMALLRTAPSPFITELERRITAVATKPWGVELKAGFSRAKVLAAYASIEQRYRATLAGLDPTIFAVRLRSRGANAFYQVRVGLDTRDAADKLCGRLRAAGGACLVLRNPSAGFRG